MVQKEHAQLQNGQGWHSVLIVTSVGSAGAERRFTSSMWRRRFYKEGKENTCKTKYHS